ncbi:hypothetical protein [Govanella unica]|uniref:Uncharacterized protein n=1 Tax=Govanella unica TaxID=2975056 RepID=A0A9X3Z8A1_9PROT|nr:hypothetical protein [Govania unica]MDA5194898.1 hypothetical protein [Govania unica]
MTAHPLKVVIVSTHRHMLAAADYSGLPDFFVMTAPAAAGYAGPGYLKLLADLAPELPVIIDCGDDPGLALRALELGWRYLRLSGPTLETVKSAAATLSAVVFTDADLGDRLTLALDRDPEPALGQFLAA